MKLDLNHDYCITTDEYNFTLQKKYVVGSSMPATKAPNPQNIGKIRYKDLGYFPTIPQLVEYLLKHIILSSHANCFIELHSKIESVRNEIITALEPYNLSKQLLTDDERQ